MIALRLTSNRGRCGPGELKRMSTPDEAQIRRAVAGDAGALSDLLKAHGPEVEGMLRIGAAWQAMIEPADVMQVTYLEAFLRIRTFDPSRGTPFVTWLRVIAENNLRDAIRGLTRQKQPPPQARIQPLSHEESLIGLYDMVTAQSGTPSAKLRREELCTAVERAISALPDRYAQVVRMYDLEAAEIDDVAKKLGRSAGAVYMMRARAHQRLGELLGTSSEFFG